jgi:hypothetical protein
MYKIAWKLINYVGSNLTFDGHENKIDSTSVPANWIQSAELNNLSLLI